MPVGSEVLVDGQYTLTYNSVALGIMEGDSGIPTLEPTIHAQPIDKTDAYGENRRPGW